jgi:uncharacterized RDD family membrane protein YckC
MKKIILKYPIIEVIVAVFWLNPLHEDKFLSNLFSYFIIHIYEFIWKIFNYNDGQTLGMLIILTTILFIYIFKITVLVFFIRYFNKWKRKYL